jgi:predicted DNA-binding protein (MmcQ/YjbR family)
MDIDSIRNYCLSLPHATEDIQWGDDLLFRIAGKIFAGTGLSAPSANRISLKCTPDKFSELIEHEGIIPAPYTARYHWVSIEFDALGERELKELIMQSYEMVLAKLPKKARQQLS